MLTLIGTRFKHKFISKYSRHATGTRRGLRLSSYVHAVFITSFVFEKSKDFILNTNYPFLILLYFCTTFSVTPFPSVLHIVTFIFTFKVSFCLLYGAACINIKDSTETMLIARTKEREIRKHRFVPLFIIRQTSPVLLEIRDPKNPIETFKKVGPPRIRSKFMPSRQKDKTNWMIKRKSRTRAIKTQTPPNASQPRTSSLARSPHEPKKKGRIPNRRQKISAAP